MLVLSRKPNEAIDLTTPDGTVIPIVLVDIRGDKARIGIEAPKEYAINRREVTEAIERERLAQSGPINCREDVNT